MSRKGFTLIELLVVIALLPNRGRQSLLREAT